MTHDRFRRFRQWFYAAAIYNVVWGTAVVLAPEAIFRAAGMPLPNYPALFQCIGMMVLVYALGYYYIARDPERYGAFVWIGLLGKVFGPLGFAFALVKGELPLHFGWTILFNDLVWWPAFFAFAFKHAPPPWLGSTSAPDQPLLAVSGAECTSPRPSDEGGG